MSIESLATLSGEFASLKRKFLEEAQAKLQPALLEVFEKHPEILKYGWKQYTPYFNYGDVCEFSVHEVYFLTSEDDAGSDMYDWRDDIGEYPQLDHIDTFIQQNEDILLQSFGDHAEVIVTREGVGVEEYDHD